MLNKTTTNNDKKRTYPQLPSETPKKSRVAEENSTGQEEDLIEGNETNAFVDALNSMITDNIHRVAFPDEEDVKSVRPRQHLKSAIVDFWITFMRITIIKNETEDIILYANWIGSIIFLQQSDSKILESLDNAVQYFEDNHQNDSSWDGVSFQSCKKCLIPFSNGADHWSLIVLCNLHKLKVFFSIFLTKL
jgi:hypothetical protein